MFQVNKGECTNNFQYILLISVVCLFVLIIFYGVKKGALEKKKEGVPVWCENKPNNQKLETLSQKLFLTNELKK